MFTRSLTILTCKRVLSLSTLYIKVCYFYSKTKRYPKKKKTQEIVERVMDGNSMRLVIVMIMMMMGFVMLALGVSQANGTTQSSLPPHFPPSPLPTILPLLFPQVVRIVWSLP